MTENGGATACGDQPWRGSGAAAPEREKRETRGSMGMGEARGTYRRRPCGLREAVAVRRQELAASWWGRRVRRR